MRGKTMSKKIFVTYKYSDNAVYGYKRVRDYVDDLQDMLGEEGHINKGEADDEDLSHFKDSTIASKLRNKIYDSSITIIMISPNMKESNLLESDQWIPWEVAYSLREYTRADRISRTNAILAIVLPDTSDSYDYFIEDNTCPHCNLRILRTDILFQILRDNMFNIKEPKFSHCICHKKPNPVYTGESSYIYSAKWMDFEKDMNKYLDKSISINERINEYDISKEIK